MTNLVKVSYTHDAMIDLIIQNPGISSGALAAHFGYTPGWVSQILASDAFQSRLAQRRAEVVDPLLTRSMEERFKGLAMRSLEVLEEKLEQPQVKAEVAIKALEISSRALGYGAQNQQPVKAPVPLEKLAENITLIFNQKRERIINGEAREGADAAHTFDADSAAQTAGRGDQEESQEARPDADD